MGIVGHDIPAAHPVTLHEQLKLLIIISICADGTETEQEYPNIAGSYVHEEHKFNVGIDISATERFVVPAFVPTFLTVTVLPEADVGVGVAACKVVVVTAIVAVIVKSLSAITVHVEVPVVDEGQEVKSVVTVPTVFFHEICDPSEALAVTITVPELGLTVQPF